jgi:hypothetical protein
MNDTPAPSAALLVSALALAAASCGGGGGGGTQNPTSSGMSILSCSLGCRDSITNPGALLSCTETEIEVNREIRLTFSNAIDQLTVSPSSFQVTHIDSGQTPPGAFSFDPADPRVLIFRPILTFDSAGNANVGLLPDEEYSIVVPGTAIDTTGPFIRSRGGTANQNRMQCLVRASQGVLDARPGRPNVTVTLDTVDQRDVDGNPISFNTDVPAAGAIDAYRNTAVRMVFDDVMDPATVANPVTRQSTTIRFFVDADGDTTDRTDQVLLGGTFTPSIDQQALTTTVIFQPSDGFPSGGHGLAPRRIVLEFLPQVADLGGNRLNNPGLIVFTPEVIDFQPIDLSEEFGDTLLEDSVRSGSAWGGGRLGTGPGGGSGRLGDLVVLPGQVVELNTDSEDFSGLNAVNFNPINVIDRSGPVVVDGGLFEFSRLRVDSGGTLRFRGSNPVRLYVRGEAVIQGRVDISGQSGTLHVSNSLVGGPETASGAGGGVGGKGGTRPDGQGLGAAGGDPNPGAGPTDVLDADTYDAVNGGPGGGIPVPDTIAPTGFAGGGLAGLAWPQPTAMNSGLHMPATPTDIGGMEFSDITCSILVPAMPGGGGAHAFDGGDARLIVTDLLGPSVTLPPLAAGGSAADLGVDALTRTLAPELGLLRGGPGGGGGGAHLLESVTNGQPGFCSLPIGGAPLRLRDEDLGLDIIGGYIAHSSAAGGAGGGAVQVAAGRRINLIGVIDASGGDGGNGTFPPNSQTPLDLAQAGGGGAGGSVLLQSQLIQIQAVPGRVDVSGGLGGEGAGAFLFQGGVPVAVPSAGGNGSPGLVRIEASNAPSLETEAPKVSPTESVLQAQYGGSAQIEDVISTATWTPFEDTPSGLSGAQSCWIRPSGNFFQLDFMEDGAEPGWDLLLRIRDQAQAQSFRGPNDVIPGMTLEEAFGSDLGSAPVVVRFQGARAVRRLTDPCSVVETGSTSPLLPGSLTDWVRHPSELNDFHGRGDLTPNVFRFVILWDRSSVVFDAIEGAEALTVTIQPE